jgi:hypothetical protein
VPALFELVPPLLELPAPPALLPAFVLEAPPLLELPATEPEPDELGCAPLAVLPPLEPEFALELPPLEHAKMPRKASKPQPASGLCFMLSQCSDFARSATNRRLRRQIQIRARRFGGACALLPT